MVHNTPNRMSHEYTRMNCNVCVCARLCVVLCFTFRSSWYFMILCTGLMSRSFSCSLWPSCCFSSCTQTHTNIHLTDWFLYAQKEKAGVLDSILLYYPQFFLYIWSHFIDEFHMMWLPKVKTKIELKLFIFLNYKFNLILHMVSNTRQC